MHLICDTLQPGSGALVSALHSILAVWGPAPPCCRHRDASIEVISTKIRSFCSGWGLGSRTTSFFGFQRTGGFLTSSPRCGRKGFRPEAVIESGLKRLDEADLRDGEEIQRETDTIGEEEENLGGEKELQRDNDTFEEEEVDLRQRKEDTADVEKNTEIPDQTVQVLGICLISFAIILTSTFILIVAMVIVIVFTVLMILLILREVRRRNTHLEWLEVNWLLRMRFLGR